MTKPMIDRDFLIASPTDCKPEVLLLATQDEISVVIDSDGNVLLRQQDALGNDPDQIKIARRNLAAFVNALIDHALPECCSPPKYKRQPEERDASDIGGIGSRDDTPTKQQKPGARSPAAKKQAAYRARKRSVAPEALPSDWTPLVTPEPER